MRYETFSADETRMLAESLAEKAEPGSIYCLTGPLGSGKTVFSQGFARGIGYNGAVVSPTFTLMNVLEGGRLTVYHFDLYRLGESDLQDIGGEDYFYGDGICLIEWPERAFELIPENAVWVNFEPVYDNNKRVIEIKILNA